MNTEISKIHIDDEIYKFVIRRSAKAKYMRLQISVADGLEIIIPQKIKNIDVDEFLRSKKKWIKKHSNRLNEKTGFFYFGKRIDVLEQFDLFDKNFSFNYTGEKLIISCPVGTGGKKEELFNFWIREKAEEYIPPRVSFLAQKHGFNFGKIVIRNSKTRWGSCTSKKNLSFSSKLMYFNHKVIDYVIIHELCHTIHLNHSKSFWGLVEEKMPMFKFYQRQLSDPSQII